MADAETVRRQRQQQLEDKRRRLEELRKRKKEKQEKVSAARDEGTQEAATTTSRLSVSSAGDGAPGSMADLDTYIKSILGTSGAGDVAGEGALAGGSGGGGAATSIPPSQDAGRNTSDSPRVFRPRSLQVTSSLAEFQIMPKVVEFYDKSCQTDFGEEDLDGDEESAGWGEGGSAKGGGVHGGGRGEGRREGRRATGLSLPEKIKTPEKSKHPRRIFGGSAKKGGKGITSRTGYDRTDVVEEGGVLLSRQIGLPTKMKSPSLVSSPARIRVPNSGGGLGSSGTLEGGILSGVGIPPPVPPPVTKAVKTLSNEEKREITQSDTFQEFLQRTSRVLERALGEAAAIDVLVDYSAEEGAGEAGRGYQGQRLTEAMHFHEDRWCAERALTDMQWSMHRPELLLASYSAKGHGLQTNSSSSLNNDPDGLVLVWSLVMQHRPEYQLSSQSPVLTARFHPFNTHVILGGTYSGQVVVWDTRAKSLPVQRTPLSTSGHTYPVYNLALLGTESAPSLMTASTDGRVSFWNTSQLSQPLQVMRLSNGDKPVTVSSMALAEADEHQELVVGSETGGIFTTPIHSRTSGTVQEYSGHYGMVTSVDVNPSSSKVLRRLVLSSSVDWTTRLWNIDRASKTPIQSLTHGTYDYVCDAKWSPKHPALFVTANISGELGLWNLNHTMEEPLAPPVKVVDRCALTRIAWSPDGRRLGVGDSKGFGRVFHVDQETALPRPDEDLKLEANLATKGMLT